MSKKEKILVVEDDKAILTGLIDLLSGEGYEVRSAVDGKKALALYEKEKPQLILLDIMIPEKSGYEVCKEIRVSDPVTPILMLTAKGQELDKVIGLELGADDYIVKPFGVNELLARVKAALRRAYPAPAKDQALIAFGDVQIDPAAYKGKKGKKEFRVTLRELNLLQFFIRRQNEVLDRFVLLDEIWGVRYEGTTRTLDQHIAKLRAKIEDNPAQPKYIATVHGIGYRFCATP